ncbi:LysR substrate-binding domain-containing protein [Methylocella sp. CPCC 101449]|uniref:LysR family transcriptional regulator n=1 Tax=Methylocella sp. CPCC 101449 TaxID=2987531 RepID=UPI00288CEFF6|nr:LysR substrate-binding domain-containing protein [Methylocella sp. CPCC 101449]MDT2019678.1 LysR substrate-binding domain-containing protein [Methylocella sp. CPCC 101449]
MTSPSHLRAFRAVMETGAVTSAATALRRAQPQISRSIAELEAEIGFPLFTRKGRRVVPTERALKFYEEVCSALDGLDRVDQVADDLRREASDELRILALSHAAYSIVPLAIAHLRREQPDLRFALEIVSRNAMGAIVSYRNYDIGVAVLPFDGPGVRVEEIGHVPMSLFMPRTDPLARKKTISAAEICQRPFIALVRNTPLRQMLDAHFAAQGLRLNIMVETQTVRAACELASRGAGLTIADAMTATAALSPDTLLVPWREIAPSPIGLIHPEGSQPTSAAQRFGAILAQVVQAGPKAFEPKWKPKD